MTQDACSVYTGLGFQRDLLHVLLSHSVHHQEQTQGNDGHERDLLSRDLRKPSRRREVGLGKEREPS